MEDYRSKGWVIPVHGKILMSRGHVYRWALVVEQLNLERSELQFGIQGLNFAHPWRLITTTRCSRSRDEEEVWHPRPGGDKRIQKHDVVHLELDLAVSPNRPLGDLRMAINDEPFELVFDDIPVDNVILPAVMLGGHGSRVRVEASLRDKNSRTYLARSQS